MSRNEADANDDKTMRSRIDALHQWLMWHGVSADVRLETTSIGIADAMLSQCKAVVSPSPLCASQVSPCSALVLTKINV